ncbi:hypothetical protein HPP92_021233 [Vanilla planifolia]|uniref:Light-regulated protein n=1 Tax=Vanilla planifolia TaxID=51239 RepID=A0A835UIC2_VANPL|nr:hypothetical protein HPP92_021233 [Vanilla planifolia]
MQAVNVCTAGALLLKTTSRSSLKPKSALFSMTRSKRAMVLLAKASPTVESVVDYSSSTSVFPAEACETIGGEACDAAIYPEAKLSTSSNSATVDSAEEECEREYLEYNEPKTVFPGEACDDLGGEFCGAEYQKGVCK